VTLFYDFFIALLVRQILRNPIEKLRRKSVVYHVLTFFFSACFFVGLFVSSIFGVEVSLHSFTAL